MDILELMKQRHSVREYEDKPIEREKKDALVACIGKLNEKYGTNAQIFFDDADAFQNAEASYGSFCGCKNFVALVGADPEKAGYVGELIALKAQQLGLNTCFVALTYKRAYVKSKVKTEKGEKVQCSMALGYGKTQGAPHKNKDEARIVEVKGDRPAALDDVIEACLLAPTAINQQKFKIVCENGNIEIKKSGLGFYTDFDLGIVKAHKDLILREVTLD